MKIQASSRLNAIPAYAFAEINKEVAALKAAHERGEAVAPIDFGIGDPSEPTPDFVIEGLNAAGLKHASTGYPSYIGWEDFRIECAAYMKRTFGVELNPETEICSNIGSKEAVFNFPEGFIEPGDYVICPSPGYPPYKTGTIFAEGKPFYVPLLAENGFLIDYEAIPEEVAAQAKIIWVNYPNSPTGAVADRKYYEGLIAWARKHEIIIAADEGCYIEIYYGQDRPLSILEIAREGIVAFYSLSKRNNMTGYRVGFLAGDQAIIDIYKKLKTNIDSGTPSICQEAGILAMRDTSHVAQMRQLYEKKRDILLGAIEKAGLPVADPAATFYIWQKVPGSDIDFAKRLLAPDIGIVVTPGSLISDECEYSVQSGMKGLAAAAKKLVTNGLGSAMEAVSKTVEGVASGVVGEAVESFTGKSKINPGEGYVRFALMPTMEEMHEAARRIGQLKGL
ncbi:aminotransferase class I/II-fold pyridoxal phosphate-dependent enzyme [Candidatus Peregrinibacteria bacterium]|nr:aminotransferase class I/II-fold pyridoxal phosphate-dependent enzyme [Candidatus Peregrinibacteria bacterium]